MAVERKEYTYTPYKESDAVSALGTKNTTANKAYSDYINKGYEKSQDVINAETSLAKAESAYNTHINNGFTYSQNDAFNDIMGRILNREKFSYDVNGDALYQQYKDKYIQQGKMAMADTMGQASAMTGGYGNSYAATVGNQAYQSSLQQLNDVVPELWQMAYDRYAQEGQDLYNQYGMLSDDRNTEYGMWSDTGNRLSADRSYYSTAADNAFNRDYGMWSDKGTMLNNDRNYYSTEYNNAYNRDYAEHTTKEGYKYQDVADANAYTQWKANYEQSQSQFNATHNLNVAMAGATRNEDGTYTIAPSSPQLTAEQYDKMMLGIETAADGGKDKFDTYLRGLMSLGYLTEVQANKIRQQYFPTITPDYTGRGGNDNFVDTLN